MVALVADVGIARPLPCSLPSRVRLVRDTPADVGSSVQVWCDDEELPVLGDSPGWFGAALLPSPSYLLLLEAIELVPEGAGNPQGISLCELASL